MGNKSSKEFAGKYDLGGNDRAIVSAFMTLFFGNLGDALARGIFYQGAYGFKGSQDIDMKEHNAWTLILPMPFSNVIGMIIHSLNGADGKIIKVGSVNKYLKDKDEGIVNKDGENVVIGVNSSFYDDNVKKKKGKHVLIDFEKHRPIYDSWVLLLVIIPILGHYSAWMSGARNPYKSFMIVALLSMMSLLMARLYTKAKICNPRLNDDDTPKKFTLGNAAHETVDAMLIANGCFAVLTFQLFFLAGYDDFNLTGIIGWWRYVMGTNQFEGFNVGIQWRIFAFLFGFALLPFALMETFLPGITYGLILACAHMFLNSKMKYNEKYKKEICNKSKKIEIFKNKPPFITNKSENWQFIFKLIAVIILYAIAISGVPCTSGMYTNNMSVKSFCPGGDDSYSRRRTFSEIRNEYGKNPYDYFKSSGFYGRDAGEGDYTEQRDSELLDNYKQRRKRFADARGSISSNLGKIRSKMPSFSSFSFGRGRNSNRQNPVFNNEYKPMDYNFDKNIPKLNPPSIKKYNGNEIPVYLREYRK